MMYGKSKSLFWVPFSSWKFPSLIFSENLPYCHDTAVHDCKGNRWTWRAKSFCNNKFEALYLLVSQVALGVKNPPASAGNLRDTDSILGLGRSLEEEIVPTPILKNPVDRGAWRVTVHRVTKSQTWLKWLSTHLYLMKGEGGDGFPASPGEVKTPVVFRFTS